MALDRGVDGNAKGSEFARQDAGQHFDGAFGSGVQRLSLQTQWNGNCAQVDDPTEAPPLH